MDDQADIDAGAPTASGILDRLRMLAREAAELDLSATMSAIEQAMNACQQEAATTIILPRPRLYH